MQMIKHVTIGQAVAAKLEVGTKVKVTEEDE